LSLIPERGKVLKGVNTIHHYKEDDTQMKTQQNDTTNPEATINHALTELGATNWRNQK